jgi:hypothetical protein
MTFSDRLMALWQVSARPILVVGHGRSGTTWVGEVLGMSQGGLYYHEPFATRQSGDVDIDYWFHYIPPGASDPSGLEPALDPAFAGLRCAGRRWQHPSWTRLLPGYRVVVKEVAALMSVEWIARRYRPKVVIVVRHPCPVILSELEQGTSPEDSIMALLRQRELFRDHLEPWRRSIEAASTPFEKLAAVWAARHRVIANAINRNRDWLVLSYEPLCLDPQKVFRWITYRLGLVWTCDLENYVEYTSSRNVPGHYKSVRISRLQPEKWKARITATEAESVRKMVERFRLPFYTSNDHWVF